MNYRRVGNSGLRVSELSLGGWLTFGGSVKDQQVAREIIEKAYESGINFFDIADIYARGESERMMGAVLKQFPRHTLVISSKVYWPMSDDPNDRGLSRKHIMESIDKSLQRIGTDYLDIYFCHRWDEETPLLETMRAMDDLIRQGKILYWGTSEWTAEQIQQAHDLAEKYGLYPPLVEQPQYNLIERHKFEQSIMPTAQANGMGLVTWSPLASGLLTGKYDDGIPEDSRLGQIKSLRESILTEEALDRVRQLKPIADDLGITRAELAIAWALRQPAISSVITGATKLSQLESNLRAAEVKLTDDVLARIDKIFSPAEQAVG
ncbi:MAG: aldo/keto reductase family protein [Aggregatilineales bacterium]|nr:aldo/keto reductase [Chloroflexota bacterium]HOA24580.1 aldo/keto reductase family protein [Aggregatilineales bacterium]HPV06214.1 aldo/keto reductase family protein [Aggregatilineales bacterium]